MKLTNLNCPQCNGFLQQERDIFCCTSCGAVFNVDYDDDDVKYTELVTEADRTRMMLQKDLELIQTQYQLREDMKNREVQRKREKQISEMKKKAAKMSGLTILGILLSIGMTFGPLLYIFWKVGNSTDSYDQKKAEAFQTMSDTLKKDDIFIENAIAAGRMFEIRRGVDTISEKIDGDYCSAHMVGEPQIEDVYLMQSTKLNQQMIYLVYKRTYEFEDSGESKEMFDTIRIKDFSIDKYGSIKSSYACDLGRYDFEEKDQLYREAILGESSYTATELKIPEN